MAFPWSGKKESGEAEHRPDALSPPAHPLEKAAELLGQANEQIAAFLVHGQAEPSGPDGQSLRLLEKQLSAISDRLERLESRLAGLSQGQAVPEGTTGLPASALAEIREVVGKQGDAVAATLAQLQEQVQRLSPVEEPAAPTPAAAGSCDWERAILGPDLAAAPALSFERQTLVDGVLGADPGACALAGQLLVFQSSPGERLPQLLKDIGEAFYRWRPKTRPGNDPMEQALVQWLQRCCEAAGIANTIELVYPGERFDTSRHNALGRGVEITEVHGWIVLRDNGKVYMKATVSVR